MFFVKFLVKFIAKKSTLFKICINNNYIELTSNFVISSKACMPYCIKFKKKKTQFILESYKLVSDIAVLENVKRRSYYETSSVFLMETNAR